MVTEADVLNVLGTINDPEMPISIVDLGMVHALRVESLNPLTPTPLPRKRGEGSRVEIELLPTFVGCPALPVLEQEVRKRVGALSGVTTVDVRFRFDPPWSVDLISERGREALRQIGITVPSLTGLEQTSPDPACPFCGSTQVHRDSAFGPTRCRMIYYCESCRNPFEHMKRVGGRGTD